MNRTVKPSVCLELNQQSAISLLAATYDFLSKNHIPKKTILDFTKRYHSRQHSAGKSRQYTDLQSNHEKMGVIMATWFSDPRFLDASGSPLPLTNGKGSKSIGQLIRVSRARIDPLTALAFMSESPSIKFERDGKICALRRVFVLPDVVVPRAAFVIERFLDTLQKNAESRKVNATLLLERSCHVSEVDLSVISPLLRDIEGRGTAFMDLIDGEIEQQRLRRERKKPNGEMGVLVFAWTKASKNPGLTKIIRKKKRSTRKQAVFNPKVS